MQQRSIIVLVILACLLVGCADYSASTAPTPTPASQAAQVATQLSPTATMQLMPPPTPTVAPTARPTTKPTVLLVKPTPTPQPTQAPRPTPTPVPTRPACVAVNNNPWCYNFTSPGKLIYVPPSGFCNYFTCIPTFVEPDDPGDGYIVECQDTTFSQSGGERGACSFHGGVMRALYSH